MENDKLAELALSALKEELRKNKEQQKRHKLAAAVYGSQRQMRWSNPDQVIQLLMNEAKLDGHGNLVGLGNEPIERTLQRFATLNPHFVATAQSAEPVSPRAVPSALTDADLPRFYGPKSDGKAANELSLKNPELYREGRKRAIAKGIL